MTPLDGRRDERDHYVRIVYRLDAAISHHERDSDDRFREAHDDALYAARERIMRDAGVPHAPVIDLERQVAGALRSCIAAHGPITAEWIGSAAKRIAHQVTASSEKDRP